MVPKLLICTGAKHQQILLHSRKFIQIQQNMKTTVWTTCTLWVINNIKHFWMPSGVWQMRLCVCEWKRNPGATADAGELHLQLPERPAGDEGLVPSSAAGYRGVWYRAESDQELEDPYHVNQEVQTHNDINSMHIF